MKKKRKAIPITYRNREFFQIFYEQYKDFLFYIAARYANDPAEREDLIQESLVRLLKNADALRGLGRGQRAKYIELTVKTAFLDMERARCAEKLLVLDQDAIEVLLARERQGEPDVSASLAVETLKASMTERDWLALEGKYILGYSHEELSGILGVTPENMRSLVSRARKRARKILHDMDQEGEA